MPDDIVTVCEKFAFYLLCDLAGAPGSHPRIEKIAIPSATAFFARAEGVNPSIDAVYFTHPSLIGPQRRLLQSVLQNWLDGKPPLTREALLAKALELVKDGDVGSALFLCHAVTRAFSKGGGFTRDANDKPLTMLDTLPWERLQDRIPSITNRTAVFPRRALDNQPLRKKWNGSVLVDSGPLVDASGNPTADATAQDLDYTFDGTTFYRPAILHPKGQIIRLLLKDKHKREFERDSIFYVLFDAATPLGTADPNDWYHCFLMATVAYYSAAGRVEQQDPDIAMFDPNERGEVNLCGRLALAFMRGILNYENKNSTSPAASLNGLSGTRFGWLWANTLSFLDGGFFGDAGQDDITRENEYHRKGTLFGLSRAVPGTGPQGVWYVPVAGKLLDEVKLAVGFEVLFGSTIPDFLDFDAFIEAAVKKDSTILNPLIQNLTQDGPGHDSLKFRPVSQ